MTLELLRWRLQLFKCARTSRKVIKLKIFVKLFELRSLFEPVNGDKLGLNRNGVIWILFVMFLHVLDELWIKLWKKYTKYLIGTLIVSFLTQQSYKPDILYSWRNIQHHPNRFCLSSESVQNIDLTEDLTNDLRKLWINIEFSQQILK